MRFFLSAADQKSRLGCLFLNFAARLTRIFSVNPVRRSAGVGDLPRDVAVETLGSRVVGEGVREIHGDL